MSKRIIYRHRNELLGWPKELERVSLFNACNEKCDMLIGPCACGAWHQPDDWTDILNRHNLEIRDYPLDATPEVEDLGDLEFQKTQATLSYF
jgi:hypothetical protein